MNASRISVIMPVFNAAPYLRTAIDSVLGQTFRDFELIIVDDGSTDGSRLIAEGVDDDRVCIFYNDENLGAAAAKNHGLEKARGEFIAFLDADDIAMPHRFETQYAFLAGHPGIGVVASRVEVIDERGALSSIGHSGEMSPARLQAKLLFYNPIAQSSVILRRDCLAGMAFRRERVPAEDYDLWFRLSRAVHMVILEDILVRYRNHPGGVSQRKELLMEKAVASIVREQLGLLAISPSSEQLQMHRGIVAGMESGIHLQAQARTWFDGIRGADSRLSLYDRDALEEVLQERLAYFIKSVETHRRSRTLWWRLLRRIKRSFTFFARR